MKGAIQPACPSSASISPPPSRHVSTRMPTHADKVSLGLLRAGLCPIFAPSYSASFCLLPAGGRRCPQPFQSVSFCLFALFLQSTFFVSNIFWPPLQKQGGW